MQDHRHRRRGWTLSAADPHLCGLREGHADLMPTGVIAQGLFHATTRYLNPTEHNKLLNGAIQGAQTIRTIAIEGTGPCTRRPKAYSACTGTCSLTPTTGTLYFQ